MPVSYTHLDVYKRQGYGAVSVKNKILHTQDLCLRTNLRCAKDSARMEINVKKQEEIFREIQEMMGETKEGRKMCIRDRVLSTHSQICAT